jgi:hypothetical protein
MLNNIMGTFFQLIRLSLCEPKLIIRRQNFTAYKLNSIYRHKKRPGLQKAGIPSLLLSYIVNDLFGSFSMLSYQEYILP